MCFSLLWAIIIITPTLLVVRHTLYYMYEAVAAMGILLAMSTDQLQIRNRVAVLAWTPLLLLMPLNGFAHNKDIRRLNWWYVADRTRIINEQVFMPNRAAVIRSLRIVTPSETYTRQLNYLINADGRHAMLKYLFTPTDIQFRVGHDLDVNNLMKLSQDRAELVYLLDAGKFSFQRVRPLELGRCEGFEEGISFVKTTWVAGSETRFQTNQEAPYYSEGDQSIEVTVSAKGSSTNHYGGIELPMSTREFALDFWIDRPEDVVAVFAYLYDSKRRLVGAWAYDKPDGPLRAGERHRLVFQPELCTDSLCECGCVRSGLAVVVRW